MTDKIQFLFIIILKLIDDSFFFEKLCQIKLIVFHAKINKLKQIEQKILNQIVKINDKFRNYKVIEYFENFEVLVICYRSRFNVI